MARRTRSSSSAPQPASLTIDEMRKAIVPLKKRISELESFKPESLKSSEEIRKKISPIERAIESTLARVFGIDTAEANIYRGACNLRHWPIYSNTETPFHEVQEGAIEGKREALVDLQAAVNSFEEQIEEAEPTTPLPNSTREHSKNNLKVFVVHGHDDAARLDVARVLEAGGFTPIILNEQANRGQSIVEKIETNDDVGFAVVLLTPDDVGGKKDEPTHPRARQNVIFELGYFIKGLGRDRVCVLKKGEVEFPSDYLGVIWVDLDKAGAWKMKLANELGAAGFELDLQRMLR